MLIKEGQPFTLCTSEATRWAAIVVPTDHEFLNSEFMKSQMSRLFYNKTARVDATVEHINSIRILVARLSAVADSISFDAAAVRCTEKEIIAAVARALEASSKALTRRLGRPSFSRARVIARILALLEASAGAPLLTVDLCRATGVAERTLRNIFHEYFGVGPMRLLKVLQLREIHAALLAADPTRETVTGIAARFGIWDFCLFARNYKLLFGESLVYFAYDLATSAAPFHRSRYVAAICEPRLIKQGRRRRLPMTALCDRAQDRSAPPPASVLVAS